MPMSGTTIPGIGFGPTGTRTGSSTETASCTSASRASMTFPLQRRNANTAGHWALVPKATLPYPTSACEGQRERDTQWPADIRQGSPSRCDHGSGHRKSPCDHVVLGQGDVRGPDP
ncbi:hypothetical protein NSPZN2_70197 [Nitrospira defluvii]|uniref:Uncharacterized protein n=1 Tax=Nitrospira defluvii TaxID=330214 RepID=A0ABM8SAW7_9BACT|nr:hypothetical protein NSPZN2_70197 [Nitrospira defluvii]